MRIRDRKINKAVLFTGVVFISILLGLIFYLANDSEDEVHVKSITGYNHILEEEIQINGIDIIESITEIVNTSIKLPGLIDSIVPAHIELIIHYSDNTEESIGFNIYKEDNNILMVKNIESEVEYYVSNKWMTFMIKTFNL